MKTLFLVPFVALLALAGCSTLPQAVKQRVGIAAPLPPPPDPKTQMAALESRIAVLIEQERQKLDPAAKKLAFDPELAEIARRRASDMAAKNYLAHAAPNGDTSASLLMAHDAKWQGLLGENLAAQHYVAQSGVDVDQFAQRFLDEWLKSQPHRENLAFSAYDRTGVGAAVNGDTVYVAQLFASDMGIKTERDPASGVTELASPAAAVAPAATATPPIRLRGAQGGGPD